MNYGTWLKQNPAIQTKTLGSKKKYFNYLIDKKNKSPREALRLIIRDDGSELTLKDLANKYEINTNSLSQRIKIKIDPEAKGILNFIMESNNPKKDQLLLEDLSNLYVNFIASKRFFKSSTLQMFTGKRQIN